MNISSITNVFEVATRQYTRYENNIDIVNRALEEKHGYSTIWISFASGDKHVFVFDDRCNAKASETGLNYILSVDTERVLEYLRTYSI